MSINFDFTGFNLAAELEQSKRTALLESQRQREEIRTQIQERQINSLVSQYEAIYESAESKLFDRQHITEAAAISAVKDLMYSIFESALLIESSLKMEYQTELKSIFETHFYSVLQENGVSNFAQFKTLLKDSNIILREAAERAIIYATMNEAVYNDILTTRFSATSVDKLMVEAYDYLGESDITNDAKVEKLRNVVHAMSSKLQNSTVEEKLAIGPKLVNFIGLVAAYAVANGINTINIVTTPMFLCINLYVSAVNTVSKNLSSAGQLGNIQSDSSIRDAIKVISDLRNGLDQLKHTSSVGDMDYRRYTTTISQLDSIILDIQSCLQKVDWDRTRPILEASATEFLAEATNVIDSTISEQNTIVHGLNQRLLNAIETFDPYKGLEELQLANRMAVEPAFHQSFIMFGAQGSIPLTLIMQAMQNKSLPDIVRKQYKVEAGRFKDSLDIMANAALRDGRIQDAKILTQQSNLLGKFLDHYNEKGPGVKMDVQDLVSPLNYFIAESSSSNSFGSLLEAMQYTLIHEATEESFHQMIALVEACVECKDDSPLTDLQKRCLCALGKMAKNSLYYAPDSLNKQAIKLESAIYRAVYMSAPTTIHEAAAQDLAKGTYPKLENFFTRDEQGLLDKIADVLGKGKSIETIKQKVVGVIESEQKRTQAQEDEDAKLLAALSKSKSLEESVKLSSTPTLPETLFEAIVMSRSKRFLTESGSEGFDFASKQDVIMTEALALYTLHETFNTLNVGEYTPSHIRKLTNDYFYTKV